MTDSTHITDTEIRSGRRALRVVNALNAVVLAFLMEHVLILYAVRNGLSDSLVALIASIPHLSVPFIFVGRAIVAHRGLARTWSETGLIRFLAILIVLPAAALPGAHLLPVRAGLIITGVTVFAIFGSIGKVSINPLTAEVAGPGSGPGRYIFGNFLWFNIVYFIAMAMAILLLRLSDSIGVYILLIILGMLAGMIGSRTVRKIPESAASSAVVSGTPRGVLRLLRHHTEYRSLVLAWAMGYAAFIAVTPIAVLTARNGYRFADYLVLVLPLCLVVGQITASLINRSVADRVGPRRLLLRSIIGFGAVAVFWAFAPEGLSFLAAAAVFVVAGIFQSGIVVGFQQYFVAHVAQHHRVDVSLLTETAAGVSAGVFGSVVASGLLGILPRFVDGLDVYRWYFRAALVLCVIAVAAIHRLPAHHE